MATQGLISVTKNGKVAFKCIAGSDGGRIDNAVAAIKKLSFEDLTIDTLFQICKTAGFGDCEVNLVIQSTDENRFDGDEDLTPLYYDKSKFLDWKFNPRWKCGIADYTRVIHF